MTPQKRLLDVSLSTLGLLVAAPVMLLIAILIRIDSPGKVIFSQKRLGKNGNYFSIHKFRKFPDDWGTKGAGVTIKNDVRMTVVGAFLERTKLDELPQLWNILKGEMSFVGPRPESTRYEHLFANGFEELLNYTPGIFGPNQVAFRNESVMYPEGQDPEEFYEQNLFPAKAEKDLSYFAEANILSDFKWIFKGSIGTIIGAFNFKKLGLRYGIFIFLDFVLFQISWFITHVIRFNGFDLSRTQELVYQTGTWLIPLVSLPLMFIGGCYRNPFRYFSFSDATRIVTFVFLGWMIAFLMEVVFFTRYFSSSITVIGLFVFVAFLLVVRIWRKEKWLASHRPKKIEQRSILIIGAGKKGSAFSRFVEQGLTGVTIVGFVDQDENLIGRYINGYKVYGNINDLENIFQRFPFNEVWLTEDLIPSQFNSIEHWANRQNVQYQSIAEF